MTIPTPEEFGEALRKFDDAWGGVDEVLYRVCREHPGHDSRRAIMAKMILIGRAYAAGIERFFPPPEGEQAVNLIGDCLTDHGSEVDSIIAGLRDVHEPLISEDIRVVVVQHGRLSALLAKHTKGNECPRSFASKYLHFHRPVVPVYDDYCRRRLNRVLKGAPQSVMPEGPDEADDEYYRYCMKFMQLYDAYRIHDESATVKDFDAFLWQVPSSGAAQEAVDPDSTSRHTSHDDQVADQADSAGQVVYGVSSFRGIWVVARYDTTSHRLLPLQTEGTFAGIAASTPTPAVIAVVASIGLVEKGDRLCDIEARRWLGPPRSSSVTTAPIRPTLAAESQEEAGDIREAIEGKRVSIFTWNMVPRVREIDNALHANPVLQRIVHEVHPELSFAVMNGNGPIRHQKRTSGGREERVAVLRLAFGSVANGVLAEPLTGCPRHVVLDAFATAWTAARVARGEAIRLPSKPQHDRFGLSMQIVA